MIDETCPVIREAMNCLRRSEQLRSLFRHCNSNLTSASTVDQIVEGAMSFFFMSKHAPITVLYQFLSNHRNKITERITLYMVKTFRDFCLIKSMPQDLHKSYVKAFRKRSEKLESQTENKELIALQLAAAALEFIPFDDSSNSAARFGPYHGIAYALELKSSDWTIPFSDERRTCDCIFTWGEPPFKSASDDTQQLKDFIDAFIQRGIMIDIRLKDDTTKAEFVGKWLREERLINKYYVAILPERNSNLIDTLVANVDLNELIVVSCPDDTSVDLAIIKNRIDEVGRILSNLYRTLNM